MSQWTDRVLRALQSKRLLDAVVKAFSVSTEARQIVDNQVIAVIKSLKLVTREELDPLRRTIERLEKELSEVRGLALEAIAKGQLAVEAAETAIRQADAARSESREALAARPKRRSPAKKKTPPKAAG